jgi:60 kDa SS-A/Ro ribonucleoprotein
MSRFTNHAASSRERIATRQVTEETTHEGAKSFDLTPEIELYSHAVNSMLQDQYYRSADEALHDIRMLIAKCSPEFVRNLAAYSRREMNLRTISQVLAVENCFQHGGSSARASLPAVCTRADDLKECMGYAMGINQNNAEVEGMMKKSRKLPKSLIRGIKDVFESGRFDEYQWAKYNKKSNPSFVDCLRLCHPRDEKGLFKKILDDTLQTPKTWETQLSAAGSNLEDKRKSWVDMVESGKLGYMAMLRNLRNICQADVPFTTIEKICSTLVSGAAKSKQFPFRFYSAYLELLNAEIMEKNRMPLLAALESAVLSSVKMFPSFNDGVYITVDTSGSMQHPISDRSSLNYYDPGFVLASLLSATTPNCTLSLFADRCDVIRGLHKDVLAQAVNLRKQIGRLGYGTNGASALDFLLESGLTPKDVLFFTDMQMWPEPHSSGGWYRDAGLTTRWSAYRKTRPDARLWMFDMAGYGRAPMQIDPSDNVILVAGWSEKVFEAADRIMKGKDMVQQIIDYKIT